MKFELKSIKVLHSLSEETYCFTATVWIDGKPAFAASNRGHGGCDFYTPVEGYTGPGEREVNDWIKANRPAEVFEGVTLQPDLEIVVGELLEAHLKDQERKRITRAFDKILGQNVAGIRDGKLITFGCVPSAPLIARVKERNPDIEIINGVGGEAYERGLLAYCPDLASA